MYRFVLHYCLLISALSIYVLPFRSSDEQNRPKDLKPKKLFTTGTLWDDEEDEYDDIFYPEYEPPYEKQINSLKTDLELKQLEIKSQKLRVQKLEQDIPTQTESGKPGKKKVVCGNCHQKTTHKEPTCQNEPCETLRQCGSHKNHPEESKVIGTAKADLARLIRESETLEAKISHQEAALDGITNSFAAKIKKTLVNSDRKKYLIRTAKGCVPNSSEVIKATNILKKHYKNKVPDGYKTMGPIFKSIVTGFEEKFQRPQGEPVRTKLASMGVKFPEQDILNTSPIEQSYDIDSLFSSAEKGAESSELDTLNMEASLFSSRKKTENSSPQNPSPQSSDLQEALTRSLLDQNIDASFSKALERSIFEQNRNDVVPWTPKKSMEMSSLEKQFQGLSPTSQVPKHTPPKPPTPAPKTSKIWTPTKSPLAKKNRLETPSSNQSSPYFLQYPSPYYMNPSIPYHADQAAVFTPAPALFPSGPATVSQGQANQAAYTPFLFPGPPLSVPAFPPTSYPSPSPLSPELLAIPPDRRARYTAEFMHLEAIRRAEEQRKSNEQKIKLFKPYDI